jgi:hypothetical protein
MGGLKRQRFGAAAFSIRRAGATFESAWPEAVALALRRDVRERAG